MIPSKTLFEAVTLAVKLARGNKTDILRQIRLNVAADGRFSVEAADGDTYVTIAGQGDGPQNAVDVCVEGKTLNGLLSNLKKDGKDRVGFAIETYGSSLKITVGSRNFKLATTPAAEFPVPFPLGASAGSVVLDGKQLDGIAWAANAVSTDETRYNMSGVYFVKGEVVAADTHRLHKVRLSPPEGMPFSGILPPAAHTVLQAARKTTNPPLVEMIGYNLPVENDPTLSREQRDLIRNAAAEQTNWADSTDVPLFVFKLGGKGLTVEIRTRSVPGLYPPFRSVLPRNTEKIATLSAASFNATLALADKMSAGRVKGVKLSANGVLDVSVEEGGHVVFQEELACQTTTPMEWGLNIPYLREAVEYIEEGDVEIVGTDAASPFVIQSPAFPERYALIMPMRL